MDIKIIPTFTVLNADILKTEFRYEETNYYIFHRNISISHAM